MQDARAPIEIFCSYAHEDEPLCHELEKHLSLLKRQGLISTWYDRQIIPGTDWAQTIDIHLESSSVILLLISSDFMASDYCYGIEMRRALQRHDDNEARVIPILLRPVDWKGVPFEMLQVLPTNTKPITSWRNRDEAFADVTAGIRRAIEDLSLLPTSISHTALPSIWNIHYSRNSFFIGREDILSRMHTQLQAGQAIGLAQPQAISGLGGIGKTQIAVEYAYRYYRDYQAVLWVQADSREALVSSYVAIAFLLKLPEKDAQDQMITVQAVKTWLQRHSKWLLILDNADELDFISEFLPPILGGHLLLTTRASALGRLAGRIEVESFSPEHGALLLLRRALLLAPDATLEQASPQDRELALQITQELGGLPLALDQAGAYLEEAGCSLSEYQHIYQHHRANLLKERRGLVADHPESVATTWSLSFARVEQRNPVAADLLRLCAFLAPDGIPEEVITKGASHLGPLLGSIAADAFLLNQAIEGVRAYSLVHRNATNRILFVHRLVQVVLRDTMDQKTFLLWAERAVRAVSEVFPSGEFETWTDCERCLPQAQICTDYIKQNGMAFPEAAQLLNQAGYYLYKRGQYKQAEPLLQLCLRIREQVLGQEHPETARILTNLGRLYFVQGKYEQAELLLQPALAIRERVLGPEHHRTARALNNLAELYRAQGKYEQAEPLYRRALSIYEKVKGSTDSATALVLNNLAELYRAQGEYEQAEPLYRRALSIREKVLVSQHPDTATSFDGLGELFRAQGKYEQAEQFYQRALAIYEQLPELVHPDMSRSLNNLAELYRSQGKYTQAEPLYQRALIICEQQLGQKHPQTMGIRKNYASLLGAMGRNIEATLGETHGSHQDDPPSEKI